MKTKLLIVLAILFSQVAVAQNAKTILNNASGLFNKSGVIVKFTLNQEDTKAKKIYSQDGTAWIKSNKFKIDVPEGITWFDGKTQWAYAKGGDEVNMSNPSGEELAAISPTVILNMYKSGFNLSDKGEFKDNGKTAYRVEMVPQSKKSDVSKFIINVNKQNSQLTSIIIQNKDGNKTTLTVKSYLMQALNDATFVFNKKDYPGIEIIDLR